MDLHLVYVGKITFLSFSFLTWKTDLMIMVDNNVLGLGGLNEERIGQWSIV